jgi:hypothetical protein
VDERGEDHARLLREVGDYGALLLEREPPREIRRLESMRRRLIDGLELHPEDRDLLARLRRQYGRELIELRDPELD